LALSVKSTIAGAALTLAISAVGAIGATGTAYAAVPGHASAASGIALQNPPGPPHPPGPQHPGPAHPPPPSQHKFRARFHTQQQCQAQARHDHPGHQELWDCRHGTDHNNPWEYWGA
jgi:hypothetical protein